MKRVLLALVLPFAAIAAEPAPQPKPDPEVLQIQVQYFQAMYQADEAKLAMAQKQMDQLNAKIAELEKKAEAKAPAKK